MIALIGLIAVIGIPRSLVGQRPGSSDAGARIHGARVWKPCSRRSAPRTCATCWRCRRRLPRALLVREESLATQLAALTTQQAIGGFDQAARYLPSAAVQQRRQAALPDAQTLQHNLDRAVTGMPFKPGLFAPFLADVARARSLPPLTVNTVAGTPLALTVGALLQHRDGGWTGPGDADRCPPATAPGGTRRGPPPAPSSCWISNRRRRTWSRTSGNALSQASPPQRCCSLLVVALSCRSLRRTLRVVTPMALSTLVTLALLHGFGVSR
ncbi:MAG: hypothetical protein WDM77_17125 [Steroidobacteraceae bacterium]